MALESLSLNSSQQVEFFFPVFEAYVEKLVQAFSQSKNKDYSDAVWQLIQTDGHIGKLLNQHVLVDAWDNMSGFLKRDSKLYGFIEEKQSGLTEMTYKFWLFFSPNDANDFFKNQVDRPKSFNTNAIITLPYIKLLEPMIEKLDMTIGKKEISVVERIKMNVSNLELAEWYLTEADFTIFDTHFKKAITNLAFAETANLLKEFRNANASQQGLERRIKNIYEIGWRYFRAKNELETRYFKKLLLDDPAEIEKGLKLMYKKVSDYKKSQ